MLLLAAGTEGSKQRNRHVGKCFYFMIFVSHLEMGHNVQGGGQNENINTGVMMVMFSYLCGDEIWFDCGRMKQGG